MPGTSIIILIAAIILSAAAITYALLRRGAGKTNDASSNVLLEVVEGLRRELRETHQHGQTQTREQLQHMNEQMSRSSDSAQRLIQEVTERLTKIDTTNKQVLDFSAQLQNLQNILKNPKQRGVLGEYWLESLLGNVLPPENYKMQYKMGVNEGGDQLIADAVIFVRDRIIPIDAKFSLENYNRMMEEEVKENRERLEGDFKADVKKRIDETSKYIQPQFGTLDFAFMFIPAEGVYYNLLNAEVGMSVNSVNLIEYAFKKKVLIVSPTSFFAYMQTVMLGLRELQIEKGTQEILKRVDLLGRHIHQYVDLHDRLGKNLSTTVNQFNASSKELLKVDKDVYKLTAGEVGGSMELEDVVKPLIEGE